MKRYIQNSTHSFIQFIGKLLNNGFTKWVLKVMLLSAVNLGYLGAISGYLKDIAIDTILPSWLILSKINSICSACSSIAGLLAFVLDLLDSKWDDYLTIRFV